MAVALFVAAGAFSRVLAAGQAPQPPVQELPPLPKVELTAGRSMVVTTDFDITRIAVTNPAVADATVVQAREILIDGKGPGTVSLIVWGGAQRTQYDVVVSPAITTLQQELQQLFPGEDIQVSASEDAVILSGHVSSNAVMLRAGEIAAASAPKAKLVNMLQLPVLSESQQVLLQVRFAEVHRDALRELGASFFTSGTGIGNTVGRVTTGQFSAPDFSGLSFTQSGGVGSKVTSASGDLTFSDFLNLFFFNEKYDIGTLIRALKTSGFFQSLAEPNLIAYNGQTASFLAGGEIPVPVVSGNSGSVSVAWKEYGIRLTFTPTIAGDTIRLQVAPEVSTLDFANGIQLNGFRIPALATRRAATDVELRDGQSFAIAGLMDNLSQDNASKVPGLAELPIIGPLFRTRSTTAQKTELMVLVTPRLVKPLNPDEVPSLPTNQSGFLQGKDDVSGVIKQSDSNGIDAPAMKDGDGAPK